MMTARCNIQGKRRINTFSHNRRFCCYKGCSSDHLKTKDGAISFFGFPIKDTERCSVWITHSGREEFRYLTPRELQEKRVCELHFYPNMFSNEFRTNLVKHAIPVNYLALSQEPIQIDDDEEVCSDDEDESGIVSETSSNNITSESHHNQINGGSVNGFSSANNTDPSGDILCVVLNDEENVSTQEKSKSQLIQNEDDTQPHISNKNNIDGEHVIEENNLPAEVDVLLEKSYLHPLPDKNESIAKKTKGNNHKGDLSKDLPKNLERRKTNTKFHNLPPQTTQSDFYFQQCPTAEETNSFSEPPDGELPLFVQQDSIVSMADDRANSETSEPPSKKRKRDKDSDDDLADQMRDAMKHLLNITALLTNNDDEFELFGKSVALQLKKMSLCTALMAQAKIQQLLSHYRIRDIKNKTRVVSESASDSEENRTEQKTPLEEEKLASPQLSLTYGSESSENETTEVG